MKVLPIQMHSTGTDIYRQITRTLIHLLDKRKINICHKITCFARNNVLLLLVNLFQLFR